MARGWGLRGREGLEMGVSGCGTGYALGLHRCGAGYPFPAFASEQLCRFALYCAVLCSVMLCDSVMMYRG